MKIALTGSDGMLGSDISRVFADVELTAFTLNDFDIGDLDKSVSAIKKAAPDYLIHSAAYTDVDGSELDPEKAYLINGLGARNIAIACEEIKCPIIYISTDYVFDGTKNGPYNEWDRPNPINQYGLSKLIGERFVTSMTNRFYVVRTSWLYGRHGKNFVETIIRLLSEKEEISVVDDQTGSPTYTYDLARTLKEIIGKGYGIYHVSNSSQCSWYEFAAEIAKLKGSKTPVRPTTSDKFKQTARRPFFSVMDNSMLRLEGIKELRHWKEALKDYMEN
ncbi:MAG: dTDP-4-dehydrorhamnose reductase [Nitrospirota bacterium]